MKRRSTPRIPKFRRRPLSPIRILFRDGRFHAVGIGQWTSYWRDPYHLFLTIPWVGFVALVCLSYGIINALFALAYLAGGDCIANAEPGSFWDAFFFSVQTLASIGYGAMHPQTFYANVLVTIEALVGLLVIALVTGLSFARFAKPVARVLFSQVAVVMPYHGIPTLMFRAANQRQNQILEAQMTVYLMRDEVSEEGHFLRRFYPLKLLRHQTPNFTLSWTAMHAITPGSPLHGETAESLAQKKAQLIISLSGIDETVAHTIHARHTYAVQDIVWNARLVDIFYDALDGHRYLDFSHFHDVERLSNLD